VHDTHPLAAAAYAYVCVYTSYTHECMCVYTSHTLSTVHRCHTHKHTTHTHTHTHTHTCIYHIPRLHYTTNTNTHTHHTHTPAPAVGQSAGLHMCTHVYCVCVSYTYTHTGLPSMKAWSCWCKRMCSLTIECVLLLHRYHRPAVDESMELLVQEQVAVPPQRR